MLNQLSSMGTEPDEATSSNAVAQLAIISGAFNESTKYPVCCFIYDSEMRILCDSCGPLIRETFMEKCVKCQAQIKTALSLLK